MKVSITSIGVALGDETATVEQIAADYGVTTDKVRESLDDLTIHVAGKRGYRALFVDAARECLRKREVDPATIDVVFAVSTVNDTSLSLYLQDALGATNAFTMSAGLDCPDVMSAMYYATSMVRLGDARRVLVVGGTQWAQRVVDPLKFDEPYLVPIKSDGAAAVLIEEGDGVELLGFGFGSAGAVWGFKTFNERPDLPPLTASRLEQPAQVAAMERLLASSGLTRDDITHIMLPGRPLSIERSVARRYRLPIERVLHIPGTPSMIGPADPAAAIDLVLRQGAVASGAVVIVAVWALGSARLVALRFP